MGTLIVSCCLQQNKLLHESKSRTKNKHSMPQKPPYHTTIDSIADRWQKYNRNIHFSRESPCNFWCCLPNCHTSMSILVLLRGVVFNYFKGGWYFLSSLAKKKRQAIFTFFSCSNFSIDWAIMDILCDIHLFSLSFMSFFPSEWIAVW